MHLFKFCDSEVKKVRYSARIQMQSIVMTWLIAFIQHHTSLYVWCTDYYFNMESWY